MWAMKQTARKALTMNVWTDFNTSGIQKRRPFSVTVASVLLLTFGSLSVQPAVAALLSKPARAQATASVELQSDDLLALALKRLRDAALVSPADGARPGASGQAILETIDEIAGISAQVEQRLEDDGKLLDHISASPVLRDRHSRALATFRDERQLLLNIAHRIGATDSTERDAIAASAVRGYLDGQRPKRSQDRLPPLRLQWGLPIGTPNRSLADSSSTLTKSILSEKRQSAANPADLAENEDVTISDAIRAKAEELGRNPLRIVNWVRNNIQYTPTFGSIQGASATLSSRRGNAFDTSSLLIALLRASGVPARYSYGTVELSVQSALNWLDNPASGAAAVDLLGQGGIPAQAIISGGSVTSLRLAHVWVNAWSEALPGRGGGGNPGGEQLWVPLDASFKQYEYAAGLDFSQNGAPDAAAFSSAVLQGAEVNAGEGWARNPNIAALSSVVSDYQSRTSALVRAQSSPTFGNVVGGRKIVQRSPAILPLTLPYRVVSESGSWSEIPASLRATMRLQTFSTEIARATDQPDIDYSISMPKHGGSRFTLSYDPAAQPDMDILAATIQQGLPQVPAYLVHVKPTLRLSGSVVAEGSPVSLGAPQYIKLLMRYPDGTEYVAENELVAGTYTAVVVSHAPTSGNDISLIQNRAGSALQRLGAEQYTGLTKDDFTGEMLNLAGKGYWAYTELTNEVLAKMSGVSRVARASAGFFSWDAKVTVSFGVATGATAGGMATDVDVMIQDAVPAANNGGDAVRKYMRASGAAASRFEGSHWRALLRADLSADDAISAVHALEAATRKGQKIYSVDPSNASALLSRIGAYEPAVAQDVQAGLAAGKHVTISEGTVSLGAWTGIGYVIEDLQTGSAAYKIAGGQNGGGYNCQCVGLNPVQEFVTGLIFILGELLKKGALAAVGTVIMTLVSTLGALCEIREAKCLDEGERLFLEGFVGGLAILGLALLLVPGAFLVGIVFAWISVMLTALITGPILRFMQLSNAGTGCRP
jgi:transglutaminase-like putative cysteine protease